MAGRGKDKRTGSPKQGGAERTAATKAPGAGPGARRQPQEEQTAQDSTAPVRRRSPRNSAAATPTTEVPRRTRFIQKPTRTTKPLDEGKEKKLAKANRTELLHVDRKRKPTTRALGGIIAKKPATAPTFPPQSPATTTTLRARIVQTPASTPSTGLGSGSGIGGGGIWSTRLRSGSGSSSSSGGGVDSRNTSLRSGRASGGGAQACDHCNGPAQLTVYLCEGCFNSQHRCRSCRARRD